MLDSKLKLQSDKEYIDYIIKELTILAENQIKIVKALGFIKALKDDDTGYNEFRKIYETHGNYIHPYSLEGISDDEKKARKLLYSNMSYEAGNLFREMMEAHYLTDGEMSNEMKDNLYTHAYNRGHSSGFNEIHNYYMDIIEDYDNLTEDELMDKLDI